jgi:ribosomal-protein-alanine N-acetyltransferase
VITERLELVPATVELCWAETRGPEAISQALAVRVPRSWPPVVFEPEDVERTRRQLQRDPENRMWTLYYVIRRESDPGPERELLGVAGYLGSPSSEGAVELGYAIAEEHQRRGYATEAVRALVAAAFEIPGVAVVKATTYASLEPSIGVLKKTGFSRVREDPTRGLLWYERRRYNQVPPVHPGTC